jgi:hypothetical protein
MGRWTPSPPSDHLVTGFMLPFVVGAFSTPSCRQNGIGEPIQARVVLAASKATPGSPASPVSRPGGRTPVEQSSALLRDFLLLSRSRGGDLLAEAKAGAVDPHPVQNIGELAGERHLLVSCRGAERAQSPSASGKAA